MDELEKRMLKEVAELDKLPVGAYNFRTNGKSDGRNSTANIQIESRESGDGINVYFKDGTKNESCHIPVIISKSGHKECVYNDFFVGSDCDVVIVAGCGISNCGGVYTMVYYIYEQINTSMEYGRAAAASLVLFGVILVFTMLQRLIQRKWKYD